MPTDVWPLLRKKYPPAECVVLQEVRSAAGFDAKTSADGVVMNLWASRGLHLIGIEVKSHRNDWLREMKNPGKAEPIFRYMDKWWLVTADESVAKLEEIPETWGWMYAKGNKLIIAKDAPKLEPVSMTRTFLAALMKRAGEAQKGYIHKSEIQDKIDEAVEKAKRQSADSGKFYEKMYKDLDAQVKKFEEESDLSVRYGWRHEKVGKIAKVLAESGPDHFVPQLQRMKDQITRMSTTLDAALAELAPANAETDVASTG